MNEKHLLLNKLFVKSQLGVRDQNFEVDMVKTNVLFAHLFTSNVLLPFNYGRAVDPLNPAKKVATVCCTKHLDQFRMLLRFYREYLEKKYDHACEIRRQFEKVEGDVANAAAIAAASIPVLDRMNKCIVDAENGLLRALLTLDSQVSKDFVL